MCFENKYNAENVITQLHFFPITVLGSVMNTVTILKPMHGTQQISNVLTGFKSSDFNYSDGVKYNIKFKNNEQSMMSSPDEGGSIFSLKNF